MQVISSLTFKPFQRRPDPKPSKGKSQLTFEGGPVEEESAETLTSNRF